MQKTLALCVTALVAVAAGAAAQESGSAVAVLASSFGEVGGYITTSAEQMPEADFAFKPTPEVRSFGQIIGHVAEVNYAVCAQVLGQENAGRDIEKAKTTKAELVEAVRASFAFCEAAYAITDARAAESITLWGQDQPRLAALVLNLTHDWEHYGNLVTYLRIKGQVPPSSQPSS